jgi:hypothetical protein
LGKNVESIRASTYGAEMNRADKARDYLSERLTQFVGFKNMSDSKAAFFDSIVNFRNTIIRGIKRYKIFDSKDIDELDQVLSEMEIYRTKGGPSPIVYHSAWEGFGKIQTKINELISITEKISIPWHYNVKDFLFSNMFIIPRVCIIVAAFIQLLILLIFRR